MDYLVLAEEIRADLDEVSQAKINNKLSDITGLLVEKDVDIAELQEKITALEGEINRLTRENLDMSLKINKFQDEKRPAHQIENPYDEEEEEFEPVPLQLVL